MSGRSLVAATVSLMAGCTAVDRQSSLDPAGIQADRIRGLWDFYLWICIAVYVAVMGFVIAALLRRRGRPGSDRPMTSPPASQELRAGIVVAAAIAVTVLILFTFLIAEFAVGQRIHALDDEQALKIRVTGHQWWWEVRYDDPVPANIVMTANEIHIPGGRTIAFELTSTDVIHSFWVPNLHGKTDMIPGHLSRTFIRADRPGEYWGQCAEFCGLQHANMRLQVIVYDKEEDFQRWLESQRQPAPDPTTERQKRGQQVFLSGSCVMCHTITGTPAGSKVGPDLTHIASRPRIAAGTLSNNRGNLGGWVTDPHGIKPGVRMPQNPLAPDDLQSLLDYLESLK